MTDKYESIAAIALSLPHPTTDADLLLALSRAWDEGQASGIGIGGRHALAVMDRVMAASFPKVQS